MNDKAEEYTKIIMEDEYIMLYDDRIAISWYDGFDVKEPDFKTFPKRYKIGFIFSIGFVILLFLVLCYAIVKHNTPFFSNFGLFVIIYPLISCIYSYVYLSDATEIKKDEIKKIHIGKVKMSIIIKNKIIKRKRKITLPLDPHSKEIAIQLLKANKLID